MKKLISLLCISILCFTNSVISQNLKSSFNLKKGDNMHSEIASGETQRHKIPLQENQFAFLKLLNEGIDVKITTYGPNNKKIEEFNRSNGENGYEPFTLSSSITGDYIVEISALGKKGEKGNYHIYFEKLQPKAVSPAERVDELFTVWDSKENPGAAVAVVKDGSIIYKKGYGIANLEYDIPITPSSVFHIASVSKQFTAFSILLLENEGKLSLDDDIRKYIPEVPDFGKTITLRHLATHTSGLRDQWNLLAMAGWRLDDVITKEHVLKLVSKQKALNFEPGEEFVYCNTGFTLLAEVVSRVSGKSFAEFTEENIFEPLQMQSTLFYDDHQKIVKNRAYSYHQDSTGYKKSVLNYANVGATSLFTTVEDLSLWAMNFSNPKVGNKEIINKLNTPGVLNNGKTFGGALGQFVGQYKGLNEIQHGGADAGYRSYLTRFPDQNAAVIVFSNDASFSSGTLAHKVADIYLENSIKPVEEKEPVINEVAAEIVKVEQKILDSYVGEYELMPGFILTVTTKDGKLFAKPTGQDARQLNANSRDEFLVEGVEAKFKFYPVGNKVDKITLEQGGQITEGKRLKAFDESEVVLQDFTGTFYSEELSTEYSFVVEDGKLIAKHSRLEDINLTPTKENSFAGDAWFFGKIDFIKNQENHITGIKVTSGRVRDVVFQKI